MWSVPQPPPVAAPASCSSRSDSWIQGSVDSFLKDGRKIRVGDCALFQAGNAPPFIGIIRWFTTSKEDCLKLCVNWLYRPADVKLPKGILLEAAPNELFYSFHKDVISAASLLHSCKVAFLRKGVELPPGTSSFVCRRVYDIANKCLWWLTDQDYINELQEEVDQLLDKTRLEMHAALQSGSRSPKPSNGPTSTQQLKSGTDSVQNSGMSIPSQAKGRKRERGGDHGTDPVKRERSTKLEGGDSASSRLDNMIKVEIPKMTEKGSLATIEDVEKLVQLVQLDKNERKIDSANKILLVDVIAATDRIECLGRFVQLRGVPVLDDWLQEAHKGKTGDGCSPKESDKGSEDLLLALLRALDKLPVNLNALQTCNVGKSVNHLRSHKNIEIQKKARSLVDTWKKRVDAEMTMINDAKSGGSNQAATCPVKQGFSEITHVASRRSGSTEATTKASISQTLSACKTLVRKPGHVDAIVKSTPITPGSLKLPSCLLASVSISSMDSPAKGGTNSGNSELPLATVKEEKSSGSSQSQNNSQSCFSDHTKTMGSSWKEDAKNSTSGSMNANRMAGGSSRHRRSSNGFSGCSTSGAQKEVNLGRSGKVSSHSGLSSERALDIPSTDQSNSQRLIVRLPNPSRSPARGANGGSIEDPSIPGTRASSPGVPDKYDHTDRKTKLKGDSCRSHVSQEINVGSWQCNDAKEGLVGSDDRAAILDEESRSADETVRAVDACKTACSSSGSGKGVSIVESKSRDSHNSMNALIESCAKCSEANTFVSAGEDIGINLLANVAAGEISNLGSVCPSGSPGSSSKEELFATDNEVKSRLSREDGMAQNHGQSDQNADFDSLKQGKSVGQLLANDKLQETNVHSSPDSKTLSPIQEKKFTSEHTIRHHISNVNLYKTAEYYAKPEVKSEEEQSATPADKKEGLEAEGANRSGAEVNKVEYTCEMIKEGSAKASDLARNSEGDGKSNKLVAVDSSLCASSVNEVSGGAPLANQQQSHAAEKHVEFADNVGNDDTPSCAADKAPCSEIADERKTQKSDELKDENLDPSHSARKEQSSLAPSCNEHGYEILEGKEAFVDRPTFDDHESPSAAPTQESEKCEKSTASKLSGASPDRGEIVSSLETSSAKLDFDLNEGFCGDDANKSEPVTSSVPVCSTAFRLPLHVSSMSSGTHSPITVAAPAKGPFVPPENLLKGKGEPGWKGSAATSAFRPAEPRKVFELPLNTSDIEKQGRPPLDIDLNVPDERVVEDMASQSSETAGSESGVVTRTAGGLGLDLNKADEGADNGLFLASATSRLEVSLMSVKRLTDGEANILRDFDLNNGPGVDEIGSETLPKSQHAKSSSNMSFLPSIAGLRMGNSELGNVSSWFTPGNSYPAVAIPSFLPDRGDQPFPIIGATGTQRILGSVNGPGTFGSDTYRGPVLPSSPAMAYPPSTAFSYAGFPFSSSFPLTSTSFSSSSTPYVDSTCFPAVLSQFVGPTSAVSSHYPRPYVVSLPEGSNSAGTERSRKWVGQGLDLNAGPGSADADMKDDRRPSASRQLPIGSSQAFVEEQARMYQISGGGVKRKDRDGGSWDERFYKQPSWQ